MKRFFIWAVAAFSVLSLSAQQFESGGLNYEVNDASAWTVTLTGAVDKTSLTELRIPDYVNYERQTADNRTETIRCTVSNIGQNSFNSCEALTSVSMPNTVTSISRSAFENCPILENISFSDNISYIGVFAFANCTSLMEVTMPSKLKAIDYSGFSGCTILNKVTLNQELETIGQSAFSGNDAMREIRIPASVKTIGQMAFYRCNVLRKVTFDGAVADVQSRAFDYSYEIREVHGASLEAWCNTFFADATANPLLTAKKLYLGGELVTDLVIPGTIKSVPVYAFRGCESLTSLTLEDGVERIEYQAFHGCPNLTDINLGNTVNTLGVRAFEYCSGLKTLTIPNCVDIIGNSCFENCSSLERIDWGTGVESVGVGAFGYCNALSTVNISDLSQWCTIQFADSSNPLLTANTLLINGEQNDELVIPSDITNVLDYTFDGGADFTSVVIPNTVKNIGLRSFWGFDKLEKISVGNGLNKLDLYNFGCSYAIKELRIEDSDTQLTIIGDKDWSNGWAVPKAITDIYVGRPLTVSGSLAPALHYLTFGPNVEIADMIKYSDFSSLKLITSLAAVPPTVDVFTEEQYGKIVVRVPEGTVDTYKTAEIWKHFALISDSPEYAKENIKIELDKEWYSAYPSSSYYTPVPFTYTITPEVFADEQVAFTSSDTSILTIKDDNTPKVNKGGEVTVTATIVSNGASATCNVSAYSAPRNVTFAEGSKLTLQKGETHRFEYSITPMMIEPNMLTWTSSDTEVLEIDENGLATAKSIGTANVKLKTYNNCNAYCTVTVDENLGVGSAAINAEAPIDVYSTTGILLVNQGSEADLSVLAPGIYIIRQGSRTHKITKRQ